MQDQQELWNREYHRGNGEHDTAEVSRFAAETASLVGAGSRLLDLGCGAAADSAFFARAGHRVVAADFAAVILGRDRARAGAMPNLDFALVDMRSGLPFRDGAFDAVYARLSLHYYSDGVTRRLFGEIRRVLRAGGLLAFMCKSTADPLYGQGTEIEPDMFLREGKVRHFFDEAYARACLRGGFHIERIRSGPETVYGSESDVVTVWAAKTTGT